MTFRLVLRGALPSDKRGTADVKHRIRRELHPQLKTLWHQHPMLRNAFRTRVGKETEPLPIEKEADQFARCGFRFVPLVKCDAYMSCALDILIMRRDEPHRLLTGNGDLDNRVKVLIDGLRMPSQCSELAENKPADDENPFYCLLEDDKVIYNLNVRTDRLLVPPEPDEPERDVVAIIHVKVKTADEGAISGMLPYGFYRE